MYVHVHVDVYVYVCVYVYVDVYVQCLMHLCWLVQGGPTSLGRTNPTLLDRTRNIPKLRCHPPVGVWGICIKRN